MTNILINGLNAKAGGGKSILNNYLDTLTEKSVVDYYYVLTPNKSEYLKYESKSIKIIDINSFFKMSIMLPFTYGFLLNRLILKYNILVILNFADIPIRTKLYQVFLFDWTYAVYPKSLVWKTMDIKSLVARRVKLYFFKNNLNFVDILIAQSEAMKKRFSDLYHIENIKVVPNAVSLDNISGGQTKDFKFPQGIKLLYLTHYYPHKNLEIFIPLAQEIKKRKLTYKLITTISPYQHQNAKKFLSEIQKQKLTDVIYNLGPVEMKHVPSLYQQCDALLMPTLLESFSGTYVEAMYHKIPIFTSNIDFASGVCKNGAKYFNPLDADSILEEILLIFGNENVKRELITNATNVLVCLPNWNQTFEMYNEIINNNPLCICK